MKNAIIFHTVILFCNILIAQNIPSKGNNTIEDTLVANNLLKESLKLDSIGKYDLAFGKAQKAQYIYEKILGKKNLKVAETLHLQGISKFHLTQIDEGLSILKEALSLKLISLNEQDSTLLNLYIDIASVYYLKIEYDIAIIYALKANSIYENSFYSIEGIIKIYDLLSKSYWAKQEYKNAINYYLKSVPVKQKYYGSNHVQLFYTYINVGALLCDTKEYDLAISYFYKSLNILKYLPPDLNNEARVYGNLGIAFMYKEDYYKAIGFYQQSLKILVQNFSDESLDVVNRYKNLGYCYSQMEDFDKAIPLYEKALAIELKILGDSDSAIAWTYTYIAECYNRIFKHDESLKTHQKALKIRLRNSKKNPKDLLDSYYRLADIYSNISEYKESILISNKALDLARATKDQYNSINTLNRIGYIYKSMGDYNMALSFFNYALSEIRTVEDRKTFLPIIYFNLGLIYSDKEDYEKSIFFQTKAISDYSSNLSFQANRDTNLLIGTNQALGIAFEGKKDYDKALFYFKKVLGFSEKKYGSKHPYTANAYNGLGLIYEDMAKYDEALDFYQKAKKIMLKHHKSSITSINLLDNNIGWVYKHKKDYNNALSYLMAASSASKLNIYMLSRNYNNIGWVYNDKGDYEKAIEYFEKAFFTLRYNKRNDFTQVISVGELIRGLQQYAFSHQKLYKKTQDKKHLLKASDIFEQALNAYQFQIINLSTDDSKSKIKTESYPIFENKIQISLALQEDSLINTTFDFCELSKSNLLKNKLKESDALSFSGIPDSLLQLENNLRTEISWRDRQKKDTLNSGILETDTIFLTLSSKLFDLHQQYDSLKTYFEKKYPDYYRLKYDLSVVDVEDVQQKLLEPEQTLLEYFVGDSSIFIFTINKDNYKVIEVKKDFPLDSLVEAMRIGIYGAFTSDEEDATLSKMTKRYTEASFQLYDKLIAPVKTLLKGSVIIIPDGVLGYIPFDALLIEKPEVLKNAHTYKYLLNEHKISYCYSATILKDMISKKHHKDPAEPFLAMAPYFKGDTSTIKSDSLDYLVSLTGLRPAGLRNGLDSLPSTGEEVTRLQRIMGGEAIIGKDATEDYFVNKASNARIIHLSTHGKMDDKIGDYSYLAFTEIPDSIENEWLYTRELYNLSLNADMVVLSACETGIGKLQRGEGIISLARAFAYAGAKSIITTLWQVKDESTKDIMILFYQNLKNGKSKDESMWLAKRQYIKDNPNKLALPYFWSGIIPIGDMHPIGK